MALGLEADNDLAAGGVLLRVVQQDIYDLPQGLGVARDPQTVCDLIAQAQAPLIEEGFKGEYPRLDQLAQVQGRQGGALAAAVRPGQGQQLLDQGAHLPGHGQNAGCRVGGAVRGAGRALQQLCVREDDSQRRF